MSQNSINSYYLHLGESSWVVLISPPLNENNFHTWSRNTRHALLSKNKLKFVDGDTEEKNYLETNF